uniref:calcium-independent phospholipase A2-gamma n=1 Tax=Myxine glutinosa TaxID=7769 RepID=UPI00358FB87F
MSRFLIAFESLSKAVASGAGVFWEKFPPEVARIPGLVSSAKSPSSLAKALSFMESNVVKREVKESEERLERHLGNDVRTTKEAPAAPAAPATNGRTNDVSTHKEDFGIPYFDEDIDTTCNDGGQSIAPPCHTKPKQPTSKGQNPPTDMTRKDAIVVEKTDAGPSLNSQRSTSSRLRPKPVTTTRDRKGRIEADPGHVQRGITDRLLLPVTSVQSMVSGWASKLKEQSEERSVRGIAFQVKKKGDADLDEKTRRLRLQREKVIARVSVDNRTRGLVQLLRSAQTPDFKLSRLKDLILHLIQHPDAHTLAVEENVIPFLLRTRQESNVELAGVAREALALAGYAGPVRGEGVRVLSIDGGGTRGLVALHTLEKLEQLAGRPIHELFDFICGVSTGAILAFMIGIYHIPLQQCHDMYRQLASDIFRQNVILGAVKMGWSHAFYDSQAWERLLRERSGELLMIETACNAACPKVAVVSTVVNRGANPKLFVFRNYNHRPGARPHYAGSCQHKIWQATRASSAAPGFFEECQLGADLHQDGALLANNPCGVAVHECQLLWPGTPLQCVVSLGTGRYESASRPNQTHTSLKAKLSNVITSATDTEEVHTLLDGLLPPDTYFRFNPLTGADVALDERRVERLEQLRLDTEAYLSRNSNKLSRAAARLTKPRRPLQRLADWLQLKMDAWDKGSRSSNARIPSKL